jgi:hypothetical protein
MSIHPHAHRIPRARIDPISDAPTALALIRATAALPPRPETILALLDDAHRGLALVSVDGTTEPDHVLEVVECVTSAELHATGLGGVIVASVRPGGSIDEGDADRWFELCDLTDDAGVELLEWFVLGRAISCPRDLVGVPPRWPAPDVRSA